MATGLLATRYVLLPQLNNWRLNIEAHLSKTLGVQVEIKRLQAQWRHLNPSAQIEGLKITLPGQPAVEIPQVSAVLSWKSLIHFEPIFLDLFVEGLTLNLRHDLKGDLWLQGVNLSQMGSNPQGVLEDLPKNHTVENKDNELVKHDFNIDRMLQNPAWHWSRQQGQLSLVDATVLWQDEKKQAPDLLLHHVNINLQNKLLSHQLNIKLAPPENLSKPIEVSVEIGRLWGGSTANFPVGTNGEIFISAPSIDLQAWKPWLDVPDMAGQFAVQAWLDLKDRQIQYVMLDFAGAGVSSVKNDRDDSLKPSWSIDRFNARVGGEARTLLTGLAMPSMVSADVKSKAITFKLKSSGLQLALPEKNQPSTEIQSVDLDLLITRESVDNIAIDIQQSHIETADGSAKLVGKWRTSDNSASGIADLTGQISHFNLPELYRYLPASTDADAFQWLSHAFKSGVVEQATFALKGALSDFPFAKNDQANHFKLTGRYSGLDIDYVPEAPAQANWPLLKGARGTLNVDQDNIAVLANWGQIAVAHETKEYEVAVKNLRVDVASLGSNPTVSVVTQTSGVAADYLNLIKYSALSTFTPSAISNVSVDGQWELPFTVNLLIEKPEDAVFDANLLFKQNNINFDGSILASQVNGQLNISEKGIKTDTLTGTVLGGPLTVQGSIGEANRNLLIKGEMSIAAISDVSKSPLMALLKGKFAYQAKLEQLDSKQTKITFETSLKDTAINLPAPLGKSASANMPLFVQLLHNSADLSSLGDINFKLGSIVNALGRLSPSTASASTPILSQLSIGLGRQPDTRAKGLSMAVQVSKFDLKRWQYAQTLLMKEIDRPVIGRSLMPDINTVRLSTQLAQVSGQDYENLSIALTQYQPNQWTLDLGASTLSGAIKWRTQSGQVQGPIDVHFPKLEVGQTSSDSDEIDQAVASKAVPTKQASSASQKDLTTENNILGSDFWRKIDQLNIRVDDFVLYRNHIGSLDFNVIPQLDERRWKINDLNINTPYGELKSNGFLRIDGNRGVNLDIDADVTDLGKLLGFVGYPDRILKGSGVMKAKIDWADFPWSKEPSGLSGSAKVDLKDGIFEHVNSRSARLLEILSLQSLRRFFSVNVNADNTFKAGFPWQSITGDFVMEKGNVNTKDLTIESPIAEIVLIGDTNTVEQVWNVEASVKPQLDLSGTAIASGFVLNPLVGLTALIGQYILKNPIEKALEAKYYVTGPWDDPKVSSEAQPDSNSVQPAAIKPVSAYVDP
jgi:uncharacterized protein (TIGR02099 family)